MAIRVDKNAEVIIQGMTDETGRFHAWAAFDYGTQMAGGMTPDNDVDGALAS